MRGATFLALVVALISQPVSASSNSGFVYMIFEDHDAQLYAKVGDSEDILKNDPFTIACETHSTDDAAKVLLTCHDPEHNGKYYLHLESTIEKTEDGRELILYPNPWGKEVPLHSVATSTGAEDVNDNDDKQVMDSVEDQVADMHKSTVDYIKDMSDFQFGCAIVAIILVFACIFSIICCYRTGRHETVPTEARDNSYRMKYRTASFKESRSSMFKDDDTAVTMWSYAKENTFNKMNESFGNLHEIDLDASARYEDGGSVHDDKEEETYKYWNLKL